MKTRLQILSCALMMLVFAGNLCAENLTIANGESQTILSTETYDAVTIEAGGVLTIAPSGVLIVGEGGITVPAGDYSCLILEVDGQKFTGGQVIVRPRISDGTPQELQDEFAKWNIFHPCATVRLISRAFYNPSTGKEAWQRYTAPTINTTTQASYNFKTEVKGFTYDSNVKTYTYQYSNVGAAWSTQKKFPLADQLTNEFECWNMICNATTPGTTYDIKGNLRTNNDLYINVVNQWSHFVNGYNANISTAAFISKMVGTYGTRTSGIVYVCKPNNSGEIKVKNDTYTWLAVSNQNAASEPWIAPMQAFFVEHTSNNIAIPEACKFEYKDIVYDPAIAAYSNASSVASRNIADNGINAKARIQLTMDGSLLDEVIMSEAEYFGDTLDWGYDARQYNQDIANLYCNAAEGQMTHLATNNLDGTTMGFNTQLAGTYKLVFSMVEGEELILRDLATQQQVAIANGFEYTFTAAGNYSSSARFQVVKANAPTAIQNAKNQNKATKLIENGQLYILRNGKKMDVLGK